MARGFLDMKLLFDQNLSNRLIDLLKAEFPNSEHVRNVGLASAPDPDIWNFAADHEYMIVSKDTDFQQRSLLWGHPPKVVWIRLGNCSTDDVAHLLRKHRNAIHQFAAEPDSSFLALS